MFILIYYQQVFLKLTIKEEKMRSDDISNLSKEIRGLMCSLCIY